MQKCVTMVIQAQSREHLGHKLVRSISSTFIVPQKSSVEEKAEHIMCLARVRHRMKLVSHFYNYSALYHSCLPLSLSLLCRLKSQRMKEQSQSGDSFSPGGRGRLSLPVSWLCLTLISASQLLLYT